MAEEHSSSETNLKKANGILDVLLKAIYSYHINSAQFSEKVTLAINELQTKLQLLEVLQMSLNQRMEVIEQFTIIRYRNTTPYVKEKNEEKK